MFGELFYTHNFQFRPCSFERPSGSNAGPSCTPGWSWICKQMFVMMMQMRQDCTSSNNMGMSWTRETIFSRFMDYIKSTRCSPFAPLTNIQIELYTVQKFPNAVVRHKFVTFAQHIWSYRWHHTVTSDRINTVTCHVRMCVMHGTTS